LGTSCGAQCAQVKTAVGTLVFFAAKEGQAALDGDDSPFAVAMLQRMARCPAARISTLSLQNNA
jgi:hypothetical protein